MYGIRSKAVHGEPVPEDRLFARGHYSFDVLRFFFLDAIEQGRVRSEDDFLKELLS